MLATGSPRRYGIAIAVLLWALRGFLYNTPTLCRHQCAAIVILAKSKETFKLSELQYLEATIQASYPTAPATASSSATALKHRQPLNTYTVSRLIQDSATGSNLFRVEMEGNATITSIIGSNSWLQQRCDWIAQVVEEGESPHEMIEIMRTTLNPPKFSAAKWTLDYVRMMDTTRTLSDGQRNEAKKTRPSYTMKSILCSVAHAMPSQPTLDPETAKDRFLILDTSSRCYLLKCLQENVKQTSASPKSTFSKRWSKRPFQYSSAINVAVAEMVIEILSTLCSYQANVNPGPWDAKMTLLDPTCGSGTFLALAMEKGFHVEGYDCNPSAVAGTIRNLEYMYSIENVTDYAKVEVRDSSMRVHKQQSGSVSCVVSNLPWGRNSVAYLEENEKILHLVREQIPTGTPCAFITRQSHSAIENPSLLFARTGYEVLGQAHVPQRDFLLPTARKKKVKPTEIAKENPVDDFCIEERSNQCIITIATASERQ